MLKRITHQVTEPEVHRLDGNVNINRLLVA